ncbi:nucleotidyltransferase domain-containing protein [Desulfobacterota bacterium AH_259_B03_O07]|nr:nucleotidyltransferase domain-containing protein [Desulfobacterota bacterium AH_259_B03_O07]
MGTNITLSKQNAVLKELKGILNGLLGERVIRIILFGSRARGDYDNRSDIDLAIIVKGLTRGLKNQILEKIAEIELKHLVPFSTLILSEKEFENLKRRQRRIALDIEREGRSI